MMTKPVRGNALRAQLSAALSGVVSGGSASPAGVLRGDAAVVAPETAAAAPDGSPPLRILLAEDNPVNQKVAQLMLARLGHRVDTVSNGLEAVTATDRVAYDVVLMDVQMPELDGLEATRRIRSLLPADRQPRIVAMTASALIEDREACVAAGMDAYLTKPVRAHDLGVALAQLAERS